LNFAKFASFANRFTKGGKKMNRHTLKLFAAALLLGSSAVAHASDKAAVIFPGEGNRTCNDYAANSVILQMSTTSPVASGMLYGTDSPLDADATGESAAYSVAGGTIVGFSGASTPVDYAILKSDRNIALIVYPSGGVTEDANMSVKVADVVQPISAISLCYGLGNSAPPPPPPPPLKTTKSCDVDAILDATGVTCPKSGERTLVCNFELGKSFFGMADGSDTCCVCNSAALTECDPSQPAGGPNACINDSGSKTGVEVPVDIQLSNDPYYRSCVGGSCTYYYYP
jgi:hypothetical protein